MYANKPYPMSQEMEITICLGSSCFSRGNGKTLKVVEEYLNANKLKGKVFFHGELCTDNCARGPILEVDGTLYEQVGPDNVTQILDKHFQ